MAQHKSVLKIVNGVTLADVKICLLTTLLTVQQRFTVAHEGLPFEIGFDNLKDAEAFFCIEVQTRQYRQFAANAATRPIDADVHGIAGI